MGFFGNLFHDTSNEEERVTLEVNAPRDMDAGEKFDVGVYGALWRGLEAEGAATHGETINAICDINQVTIELYALEAASGGEQYIAGNHRRNNELYEYILTAPAEGVKQDERVKAIFKDVISKKLTKFTKNENQIPIPSETRVEAHITEICATFSEQLYEATNIKHFKLDTLTNQKAKVVIFDDHGDSNSAIPAFGVAVTGETMIMGWRGSNGRGPIGNAILDAISDFAIGPVVCSDLGEARYGIRMHNAMSSFAASDLDVHGDKIRGLLTSNKINEIVFTGHSLGGGIACTAHPIVQAQILGHNESKSAKKWIDFNKKLTLKSVVFSAPMSIVGSGKVVDPQGEPIVNKESDELLKIVGENTTNLIFGCDIVPRGFSQYKYFAEVLDAIGREGKTFINKHTPLLLRTIANSLADIDERVDQVKNMGKSDLVPAIKNFRHVGKLLYYKNENAVPISLDDTGPIEDKRDDTGPVADPNPNKNAFNHYTYNSLELPNRKTAYPNADALLHAHTYPKNLLASYLCTTIELTKSMRVDPEAKEPDRKKQKPS